MRSIKITPDTLRDFFFRVLELGYNQTPSHRSDLPMKKNQSLSFMIDSDLNFELVEELYCFSSVYSFILRDSRFPDKSKTDFLRQIMGVYSPVLFKLIIDDFEELHYTHSSEYTFINFRIPSGEFFSLPIERISNTYNLEEE